MKGAAVFLLTMSGRLLSESSYSEEDKLQLPAAEKPVLTNMCADN